MTQLQEVSYQIDIAQVKNCSLSCNSRGRKTFTMKICVKASKRLLTSFYKNNSTHVIKKSQPFCPCTIACWNQLKSSLAAFSKYWFKIYNKFFVTNHRSHNCNNTDKNTNQDLQNITTIKTNILTLNLTSMLQIESIQIKLFTLTHPVKVQCVGPHHPEPGYHL